MAQTHQTQCCEDVPLWFIMNPCECESQLDLPRNVCVPSTVFGDDLPEQDDVFYMRLVVLYEPPPDPSRIGPPPEPRIVTATGCYIVVDSDEGPCQPRAIEGTYVVQEYEDCALCCERDTRDCPWWFCDDPALWPICFAVDTTVSVEGYGEREDQCLPNELTWRTVFHQFEPGSCTYLGYTESISPIDPDCRGPREQFPCHCGNGAAIVAAGCEADPDGGSFFQLKTAICWGTGPSGCCIAYTSKADPFPEFGPALGVITVSDHHDDDKTCSEHIEINVELISMTLSPWDECDPWPPFGMRGLGDSLAKLTKGLGFKSCAGCKKRQGLLNRLFPWWSRR